MWREQLFNLDSGLNVNLDENPVIKGSLTITAGKDTLLFDEDYFVNHRNGSIRFKENYGLIKIEYASFPQNLQNRFFEYQEKKYNTETHIKERTPFRKDRRYEDLNLNVKGNKTISISVSDDDDFQLDQSLFLQINGELAKNVNVQAQVSDSQSPLTPEGNSRELSNLDKIFIRIYGNQYELGFGDLEHRYMNSYFLDFEPVYEGIKGSLNKESSINAGLGLTKSETRNIELSGVEGRQGPYWLENSYNGDAVIVSGTEKLFLNGIEMQRGDDYTIDYAEGSITFRDKHFISSSDRIYVIYQYSDEDFSQTVYLGEAEIVISDNFSLGTGLYYLKDDAENPLNQDYSESDRDSLSAAGDNSAFGSGIYLTEEGLGNYILLEEGYYQYVGLDSTGTYNITFYESEQGDYIYNPDGYYEYSGNGTGNFQPGIPLSSPKMQANYFINSRLEKGDFSIKNEFLYSHNDLNTISDLDDEDNDGWAGNFDFRWRKQGDRISPFGEIYWQYLSKDLYTFDPVGTANDFYESGILTDSLAVNEIKIQTGFNYIDLFSPKLILKRQQAGDFRQDYIKTDIKLKQNKFTPQINYQLLNWEKITIDTTRFVKHNIEMSYALNSWEAGANYINEEEDSNYHRTSENIETYLQYEKNKLLSRIYWENNSSDSTSSNVTSNSETRGFLFEFKEVNQNLKLNFAHRELSDSTKYDIGEFNYRGKVFDVLNIRSNYQIRNLDFYPRVKELVYVGDGLGNYNEEGEEENEGDYDWEITSIDYSSRESSIELTADAGLDFSPSRNFPALIQKLRFSLNGDLTEQSTTSQLQELYLLQSSELMDENKTIYGRQNWDASLWYDLYAKKLKLRLTLENDERLDNRYQNGEKFFRESQEANLRWKYSRNWNYELNIANRNEEDSRYDLISRNQEASFDIKHSPASSQTWSVKITLGKQKDRDESENEGYELIKTAISPTLNWYPARGKRFYAKISYRHNETKGLQALSWQEENRQGDVFTCNLSYDYQISKYITLSADYKGEKYPLEKLNNEIGMEFTAEF